MGGLLMLNFFKWKRKTEPVPANVRAFNAAMLNAWNHDLMTQCVKTNDDIRRNGDKLRDISREMAKNCGDYRKYLNLCCRNIVGDTGIKLQMNVRLKNGKKDHFSNRVIEEESLKKGKTGDFFLEDSWGGKIYYRYPGQINKGGFDLIAPGADGGFGSGKAENPPEPTEGSLTQERDYYYSSDNEKICDDITNF